MAREEFEKAAKIMNGKGVLFAVSTPNDGHGHYSRLSEYLGVNIKATPALMLIAVS